MSGKVVIESIARGAEKLIGENRRLRSEVEKLETSKEKLREENRRLAAENAALLRRLTVRDLAVGFAGGAGDVRTAGGTGNGRTAGRAGDGRGAEGGADIAETGNTAGLDRHGVKIARARVNRLMREVDRCIALLSRE
jgi:hypothetical protein